MKPTNQLSLNPPTEPNPQDWLTEQRLKQVMLLTKEARSLLCRLVFGSDIELLGTSRPHWKPHDSDEQKQLNDLEEQWRVQIKKTLRAKLQQPPAGAKSSRASS